MTPPPPVARRGSLGKGLNQTWPEAALAGRGEFGDNGLRAKKRNGAVLPESLWCFSRCSLGLRCFKAGPGWGAGLAQTLPCSSKCSLWAKASCPRGSGPSAGGDAARAGSCCPEQLPCPALVPVCQVYSMSSVTAQIWAGECGCPRRVPPWTASPLQPLPASLSFHPGVRTPCLPGTSCQWPCWRMLAINLRGAVGGRLFGC